MSLTAANSVIMLVIPNLFDSPQLLQGYAADDVFDVDQVKMAETLMGVDGRLSGGFIYEAVQQTINLQADSASAQIFDAWYQASVAQADVYPANATITLPGLGQKWTCTRGFLTSGNPMPSVKKLVQPRKWLVMWQAVSPAPL